MCREGAIANRGVLADGRHLPAEALLLFFAVAGLPISVRGEGPVHEARREATTRVRGLEKKKTDVQAQAALFLFFGRVFSAAGCDRPVGSGPCGRAGRVASGRGRRGGNAADLVKSDSEEIAWTNSARAVLGHCSLSDQSSAPVLCARQICVYRYRPEARSHPRQEEHVTHEGRLKSLLFQPLSRRRCHRLSSQCARARTTTQESAPNLKITIKGKAATAAACRSNASRSRPTTRRSARSAA